jgi:hypothetical protein
MVLSPFNLSDWTETAPENFRIRVELIPCAQTAEGYVGYAASNLVPDGSGGPFGKFRKIATDGQKPLWTDGKRDQR